MLGWEPAVSFEKLVAMMVDADLARLSGADAAHERPTVTGDSVSLKEKIRDRKARIGVIGLGYVGLPLAVEFAKKGFDVTGFDVDASKIAEINAGRSYILDVKTEEVDECVKAGRLRATTDMSQLEDMDAIDICVPTPLRKTKDPDLSYVVQAVDAVQEAPQAGSARHPRVDHLSGDDGRGGAAGARGERPQGRRRLLPRVLARARRSGQRVLQHPHDPEGRRRRQPASTELASDLYGAIVDTVVPVSSTQVAEMVKLLENTFRAVNIGLVNEIALMSHRMNIDVWEVIDAARTKPFGFMPFYPGPGPRRTLHSDRSRSTCPGRRARADSNAASSSWPATSTARCRRSSSNASARR